jgi:hypothetical protein
MNPGDGGSGAVIISWEPIPTTNICFPIDTPIQTDQGIIPIQYINPQMNTIAGKPIQHITTTTTIDPYLICFEPHALGPNYPSKTTIMTKDHQIMYDGKMVPAYRFLDFPSKVKKTKYTGEILYNVLMEEHGLVHVNNLICETLHPDNLIAKIYNSPHTQEYKNNFIDSMNDSLRRRDGLAYKSIINTPI